MKDVKEMEKTRNLKVYGYRNEWNKSDPKIVLQGKWLEQYGFDVGDQIKVVCRENELIVSRT